MFDLSTIRKLDGFSDNVVSWQFRGAEVKHFFTSLRKKNSDEQINEGLAATVTTFNNSKAIWHFLRICERGNLPFVQFESQRFELSIEIDALEDIRLGFGPNTLSEDKIMPTAVVLVIFLAFVCGIDESDGVEDSLEGFVRMDRNDVDLISRTLGTVVQEDFVLVGLLEVTKVEDGVWFTCIPAFFSIIWTVKRSVMSTLLA